MTIDEIKQALHKADLTLRPWIVFASPSDAKVIKEALPRIEEEVIIQETEAIESGKAIAIKREELKAWTPLPEPYAERRQEEKLKKKMLFSDRQEVVREYKKWCLINNVDGCEESFLAYLCIKGYIDG